MTLEELNAIEAGENTFRAKAIAKYTELFESMPDEKLERRIHDTPPITAELANSYISTSILILEKQAAHLSKTVMGDKFKNLIIETAYYTEMLGQLFPDIGELTNPQYGVAAVRQALDITHEAQEKFMSICYPELKGPKAVETPTTKTDEFDKDIPEAELPMWNLNKAKFDDVSDEEMYNYISKVSPITPEELGSYTSIAIKNIKNYAKRLVRGYKPEYVKKALIIMTHYTAMINNYKPEWLDLTDPSRNLQLMVDKIDSLVQSAKNKLDNI